MPSKSEREQVRAAARASGMVAQTAFGPDAAQRNLLTAPIYKAPPAADVPAATPPLVPARPPEAEYGSLPIMPVELLSAPSHLSGCYGFADAWGCEQGCPVAEARYAAALPDADRRRAE